MQTSVQPTKRSFGSAFLFQPATWLALGWCLFGLSWLLPNHYNPWLNFHSETLALASVALLFGSVLCTQPQQTFQYPHLAALVLSLSLVPWFQWGLGISHFIGDAILGTYYLPAWATAIFLGYHFVRRGRHFETLMHVLWIVALLSAYIGLLQWLKVEYTLGIYAAQTSVDDPAMGNLGQPNQMATLMLTGVMAYAYAYERRVFGVFTFIIGIFVMTAVLVLTHSRVGMLGTLTIAVFFWVKKHQTSSRIQGKMVLIWMVMFVMATLLSPYLDQELLLSSERETLLPPMDEHKSGCALLRVCCRLHGWVMDGTRPRPPRCRAHWFTRVIHTLPTLTTCCLTCWPGTEYLWVLA
ncbi:MAG: pilin glycosylation ligase domain-containing protein [Comamonadaceae bacterium]|nr:pilin glycosylation ligase domain-containing protein [Comamonadaceae bacterium]